MAKSWRRLRTLLILLSPGIPLGMLAGAYPGYRTYSYVWKSANFCISCHVHDYANTGWARSSHGGLTTCHDCHHQPLHAYPLELYALVRYHPKFPKDLHHLPHVPKDLCEACHLSHPEQQSSITGPLSLREIEKLPKVDRLKLHRLHLSKKVRMPLPSELRTEENLNFGAFVQAPPDSKYPERPVTCMDCHGGPPNRAHNFTATDRSCVQCHQKMHDKPVAREMGCRSCHFQEFMTPIADEKETALNAPGKAKETE